MWLALALVLLVVVVEVVITQYTRAALHAAAVGAARSGSSYAATLDECRAAGSDVLTGEAGLLRGDIGSSAQVECRRAGNEIVAVATATVDVGLAFSRTVAVEATARSIVEAPP